MKQIYVIYLSFIRIKTFKVNNFSQTTHLQLTASLTREMRTGSKRNSKQQKSNQQKDQNKNSKKRDSSTAGPIRSPSPEIGDDSKDCITISRYGKKDDKNVIQFTFPLLTVINREELDSNEEIFRNDDVPNDVPMMYFLSAPETKFHISVKELLVEWEDYQAEVAGFVECMSVLDEYLSNTFTDKNAIYWNFKNDKHNFITSF